MVDSRFYSDYAPAHHRRPAGNRALVCEEAN